MRYSPKTGNRGYFSPKVKQPGRVGDHTHLHISAEVKNEWSYTYITQYTSMVCTWATLI